MITFDPLTEIAKDMHKKMEKILSPPPAVAIINELEIVYMDEELKSKLDYIKEYINSNFNLIEDGQYSFPISGTLLGFFKMSSKIMFVLFAGRGESGDSSKIGKLLLFRGLLENYHQICLELSADLSTIKELEKTANLVLRLRNKPEGVGPSYVEKVSTPSEYTSGRIEIGGIQAPSPTATDAQPIPAKPSKEKQVYPELMEKYRNKKFNFIEGLILQYCDGKTPLEEIILKTKYSKDDVMEVLDGFEKKGWLTMHKKAGAEGVDRAADDISTAKEELGERATLEESEVIGGTDEISEFDLTRHPLLLEKYRTKKFNFQEGIILQYCDGKTSIEEIIKKSNFSADQVFEVLKQYQKKEYVIIRK